MIEATFMFGIVIALGLALLIWKLPRGLVLWLLGHHLMLDVLVFALALWIHWGTMTGLMAATVAGLVCSLMTSAARKTIGYKEHGRYVRGVL